MRAGNEATAQRAFANATQAFRSARRVLASPLLSVGLAVPIVDSNVRAAREVVTTGENLAAAGDRLARGIDPKLLELDHGNVPIAELQRVARQLDQAGQLLRSTSDRLAAIPRTYLLPILGNAIDQLQDRLRTAQTDADRVALAARVAPDIFGAHGTRRYFLAVQNSAELRATGGFIGNWGILVAERGHVTLQQFGRVSALDRGGAAKARELRAPEDFVRRYQRFGVTTTWQNVNMSPDFPTVGSVMQDLLPQSGGPTVDGTIAIDSSGLSALLRLTGPVRVASWPDPITSQNVVDVTLRDAYARFPDETDRANFLGDVAHAVWSAATTSRLGSPEHIANTLSSAALDGHLLVWLAKPGEERAADAVGISGRIASSGGDSLLVVTQNAAGNKIDYYLHRRTTYSVTVSPVGSGETASVRGRVTEELANDAPAAGLPKIVIGPYDSRYQPGENLAFVSVYTPHGFGAAQLDGSPALLESARELDRWVYSSFVKIPARSARTLTLNVAGSVRLVDGWYRLDVLKQPTLRADELVVNVDIPHGWRVAEVYGGHVDPHNGRRVVVNKALSSDFTLGIRLVPERESLLDRLRGAN
jgi:hypothetical protein